MNNTKQTAANPVAKKKWTNWALLALAGVVIVIALVIAFSSPAPERTAAVSPKDPNVTLVQDILKTAMIEIQLGQIDKSIELMSAYVQQVPDDVSVRPLLAQALILGNKSAAAEREVDEILQRRPNQAEVLWMKGELIARRGGSNYLPVWQKAVQAPDATPETWLRFGLRMLGSGDETTGEEYIRKAFQAGIKDYRTYSALGRIAYKNNRFEEALSQLNEALQRRPDEAKIWLLVASCYKHLNQTDKALQTLEEALKSARGPERSMLLMELGDVYRAKDNIGQAAQVFADASAYPEVAADAAYRAARCYYLMEFPGHLSKALAMIDKAAELRPIPEILEWKKKIEDEHFVGSYRSNTITAPALKFPGQ